MSKTEQEARIAQVQNSLNTFNNPGAIAVCKSFFYEWQYAKAELLTILDEDPAPGAESSSGDESSESEEE